MVQGTKYYNIRLPYNYTYIHIPICLKVPNILYYLLVEVQLGIYTNYYITVQCIFVLRYCISLYCIVVYLFEKIMDPAQITIKHLIFIISF